MKLFSLLTLLVSASCSGPGDFTPTTKVERQLVGFLQKFDRWDLNGDGKLVAGELKEAQKRTGQTPAEILAFYDDDKDGGITLREAQDGLNRTDEAEIKAKQ